MTIRVKCRIDSISRSMSYKTADNDKIERFELRTINLSPVADDQFSSAPPSGRIELHLDVQAAKGFELGQEVYVDFSPIKSSCPAYAIPTATVR